MSRLRTPILTLTFCAAAAAVVVWDAHRRALESIDAHRREVEAYFSQAEDRARSRPPLFDPPAPGNAWDTYRSSLKEVIESPVLSSPGSGFKDGSAALSALRPAVERLRVGFHQAWTPPADPEELGEIAPRAAVLLCRLAEALAANGRERDALDLVMVVAGLTRDFMRVGREADAALGCEIVRDAAIAGLRALEAHAMDARDLETLAWRLDRLDQARPALSAAFEWGRLYWKRKALTQVLLEEDMSDFYAWKDFRSKALFHDRVLREIDDHHRAAAERGRRPPWERVGTVPHGDGDHAVAAQFYKSFFCCAPNADYEKEVMALEHLALLRVALALAWHQAESGQHGASLQDLAPRYLRDVPVSPLDGKPFDYADGVLISRDLKGKSSRWTVNKR